MTITVGKDENSPSYDVKLTDKDGNEVGLILSDKLGMRDPSAMLESSMPRTAMRTSSGGVGYGDLELPFVTEIQQTWMGGRGQEDFSRDRTRYSDAYRMDTTKENPICGPGLIDQSGIGEVPLTNTYSLIEHGTQTQVYYLLERLTVGSAVNIGSIKIKIKLYKEIAQTPNETHGKIGYIVDDASLTAVNPTTSTLYSYIEVPYDEETIVTLPCNLSFAGAGRLDIILKIPCKYDLYYYSDNTSQLADSYDYSWFNDQWNESVMEGDRSFIYQYITTQEYRLKLFEYKRALYAILNPADGTAPSLYINGYRGSATSNSANLGTLCMTGTYAADALEGTIALIIDGLGETEVQPWRKILSNIVNAAAYVSTPWKITHDTTTDYVIIGTNIWTEITGHGLTKPVTDVVIASDYVIFAQGAAAAIRFMREYNNAGTWTRQWGGHASNNGAAGNEAIYADFFAINQLEDGDTVLWRVRKDDSKVDYSYIGAWDVTGDPLLGTMLFFDVNKYTRADLTLQKTRATADKTTEEAKAAADQDADFITSLTRQIEDLTWQITETSGKEQYFLPYYVTCGNLDADITNIVIYGTPALPYIMKEDGIGYIYNNIYTTIPIPELGAVRSEINGVAAMQYGVYLYFNLAGGLLERYYDQRLDDVGSTKGEGLPPIRQGEVSKIIQYAGRFYQSINAGVDGYSSVLCSNELGWHETYRSTTLGNQITDIYIQAIPGFDNADRLWISEGSNIFALPIAINPLQQSGYEYFGYDTGDPLPHIITSWMDFELKDVNKYFHSITLFTDYPNGTVDTENEFSTKIWYRIDSQTDWIEAGGGSSAQIQEILIDQFYRVAGKKIQFKIEFQPREQYKTPRLKAIVVNGVLRVPVKKSWSITFALDPTEDLNDIILNSTQGELLTQLNTWSNSETHATPLIMRTNDYMNDNKVVFIDPLSITTYNVILDPNTTTSYKQYQHVATMTIFEVIDGASILNRPRYNI